MDERAGLPAWVVPGGVEVRDLSCLAMRLIVEKRHSVREAAGMVAVTGWLRGLVRGPVTGRTDSPVSAEVGLAEYYAAESPLDDGGPVPPVRAVCEELGMVFWPACDIDPGYAMGVWLTLRWARGTMVRPPLDLPIRRRDGAVMGEVEVYAELLARHEKAGHPLGREQARETATALVADSRRLAGLVEDIATRVRA